FHVLWGEGVFVAYAAFGIDQENGRDSPDPEGLPDLEVMIESGGKSVAVLFPVVPGLALGVGEAVINNQYLQSTRTELPGQSVDFGQIPLAFNAPGIPENKQQGLPRKTCSGKAFAVKGLNAEIRQRLTHLGAPHRAIHGQQEPQHKRYQYRDSVHSGNLHQSHLRWTYCDSTCTPRCVLRPLIATQAMLGARGRIAKWYNIGLNQCLENRVTSAS